MITRRLIPPLETALRLPGTPAPGAPLVALLHGRGADLLDLAPLADWMPDAALVAFPRAPFPGAPWGYGPGWAWYRFQGGTTPEPESFEAGQRAIGAWLAALRAEFPAAGPLILGGFSQGGTAGLAYALRNPGTIAGVLNLSGFLADHPTVAATAATVAGTRIFWGHGTQDPSIPHQHAAAGRKALLAAGADLVAKDYPMGHAIGQEELYDVSAWVEATVAGTPGSR